MSVKRVTENVLANQRNTEHHGSQETQESLAIFKTFLSKLSTLFIK